MLGQANYPPKTTSDGTSHFHNYNLCEQQQKHFQWHRCKWKTFSLSLYLNRLKPPQEITLNINAQRRRFLCTFVPGDICLWSINNETGTESYPEYFSNYTFDIWNGIYYGFIMYTKTYLSVG